jgi:hypothetical protein
MQRSLRLCTLIPLFGSLAATAGEVVDRTLAVAPDGSVEVGVVRGEVAIAGWDRSEVRVTGTLDDLTREFTFATADGHTRVIVEMTRTPISWGEGSDLEIFVPRGSRVSFKGVSTNVAARDLRNGLDLAGVSGRLELRDLAGRLRVDSVSGDVEIEDSAGSLHAVSVSGSLRVDMDAEDASLDSVSGDIRAGLQGIRELRARSISGDIEVEGALAPGGRAAAESVSGDVRLGLRGPVNARLRARSASGEIANGLGGGAAGHATGGTALGGTALDTHVGDGAAEVELRTVSGDVRLEALP